MARVWILTLTKWTNLDSSFSTGNSHWFPIGLNSSASYSTELERNPFQWVLEATKKSRHRLYWQFLKFIPQVSVCPLAIIFVSEHLSAQQHRSFWFAFKPVNRHRCSKALLFLYTANFKKEIVRVPKHPYDASFFVVMMTAWCDLFSKRFEGLPPNS